MEDHHRLYWAEDPSISLTGGDDTILYGWFGLAIPPWTGDPLALGDVWVVGSDPANQLYGGSGHIDLVVEELPSGDLKIYANPTIDMTVEDFFDFDYWTGYFAKAAASIQCAHTRPTIGAGIGNVAMLRFEVQGPVSNVGDITVPKP